MPDHHEEKKHGEMLTFVPENSKPEKIAVPISNRMWTLLLAVLTFIMGMGGSLAWDRLRVEHLTAVSEQAIVDISNRVTDLEAMERVSLQMNKQVEVNTKRVDMLEMNGSAVARETAVALQLTTARLMKLENATIELATTTSGLVTSQRALLELSQDIKRLDMLAHSASDQVSEKEFQAVKTAIEMHEQETNARLLQLDNKISQVLTMMAADQERKRRSLP